MGAAHRARYEPVPIGTLPEKGPMMSLDLVDLRERDIVELLPDTLLPPGHRAAAGARGRILYVEDQAPGWVTVQFGGRFRRPVRLLPRQVRRLDP
jgi:hypothetical protein